MGYDKDDLELLRLIKEAGLEEKLIEYSKEQEKLAFAQELTS